ncbi:hypothetical protein [Variovorax rhizosphaerae]|uniref:Uncharacterized protein n=1 Tax=Variovorax rhizosphaerae TaxID=1836200 RepID=A0ABU8WYY2_9BURK
MRKRTSDDLPHHDAVEITMPQLSDEAAVQIQNFIHHVLDLFEARYGAQIHRFYDDRSRRNMLLSKAPQNIDDPPF